MTFPNTHLDRQAWEMAKEQLPGAPLREIIQVAQTIKQQLQNQELRDRQKTRLFEAAGGDWT
jgi:hypothetical protein